MVARIEILGSSDNEMFRFEFLIIKNSKVIYSNYKITSIIDSICDV